MIDSNEAIMYENGRDAGYSEGYEDALENVATIICNEGCGNGGCPCKKGCEVYSDQACIERIIEYFKSKIQR